MGAWVVTTPGGSTCWRTGALTFAGYFDIDWTPPLGALAGKVLVPVLGDNYGEVLIRGELELEFDSASGQFSMRYSHHRLPIDPRSYPHILRDALPPGDACSRRRRGASPRRAGERIRALPAYDGTTTRSMATPRARPGTPAAGAGDAGRGCPAHRAAHRRRARGDNGRPADAASFDALHALLEAQSYRVACWRVAADEINYRRFFDINELAALRTEDPEVFADSASAGAAPGGASARSRGCASTIPTACTTRKRIWKG